MNEPASTPPLRTWRPMAAGTAAILLTLGLAWFVAAVVIPFERVRRAVAAVSPSFSMPVCHRVWPSRTEFGADACIARLGGAERASRMLERYYQAPSGLAPHKKPAVYLMGECGSSAFRPLRMALNDRDEDVRLLAVNGLARIAYQDGQALQELEQALVDPAIKVRREAVAWLLELGPRAKSTVPALIRALSDTDREVRTSATLALTKIGPEARDAVPSLGAALCVFDGGDATYAEAALAAIGADAVPTLIKMLEHEDSGVKTRAALTLAKMGPAAEEAVPALTKVVTRREYLVSSAAAKALGEIGPKARSAIPALRDAVKPILSGSSGDGDWMLGLSAALAQILIDPPQEDGMRVLIKALRHNFWQWRCTAVLAMTRLGPLAAPAKDDLILILGDQDSDVMRSEAAKSLGNIGREAVVAIPALEKLLDDKVYGVRDAAASALKKIRGGETGK